MTNGSGERVSHLPLPKLYEASHGMCRVCATRWMEQVLISSGIEALNSHSASNIAAYDGRETEQSASLSLAAEFVEDLVNSLL